VTKVGIQKHWLYLGYSKPTSPLKYLVPFVSFKSTKVKLYFPNVIQTSIKKTASFIVVHVTYRLQACYHCSKYKKRNNNNNNNDRLTAFDPGQPG